MLIIPIFFICLAFFIRSCGQTKLDYDLSKHIIDKNKESIEFFNWLSKNFTKEEIAEFMDVKKSK